MLIFLSDSYCWLNTKLQLSQRIGTDWNYGGLLTLIVILMVHPGAFVPVRTSNLVVRSSPTQYKCEECDRCYSSIDYFSQHQCRVKREREELPDSICNTDQVSDFSDLKGTLAASLIDTRKVQETGFRFQVITKIKPLCNCRPAQVVTCRTKWNELHSDKNISRIDKILKDHVEDCKLTDCEYETCSHSADVYALKIVSTKINLQALPDKRTQCLKCKKLMSVMELKTHVEVCEGQFCMKCNCDCSNLSKSEWHQHSHKCCVVENKCRICSKMFSTAAARAAHEINCNVDRDSSSSRICTSKVNAQSREGSTSKSAVKDLPNIHNLTLHPSDVLPQSTSKACSSTSDRSHNEPSIATSLNETSVSAHPPDVTQSAIDDCFKIIQLRTNNKSWDFELVLQGEKARIVQVIRENLTSYKALKFYISLNLSVSKEIEDLASLANFRGNSAIICESTSIDKVLEDQIEKLVSQIDEYTRNGSGWVTRNVVDIHLHFTKYQPMKGGSYFSIPKWLHTKRSIVNIKNNDNKCLLWCCLAAKYEHITPVNSGLTSSYIDYLDTIKTDGVEWPITFKDITLLESLNNFCINVLGYATKWVEPKVEGGLGHEEPFVYPMHISDNTDETALVVNVIYLKDDATGNSHYVWVKNLARLISAKQYATKSFACVRCFHLFKKEDNLRKHVIDCRKFKVQRTSFPKEEFLMYKAFRKTIWHAVYLVADFECLLIPNFDHLSPDQMTHIMSYHVACGYSIKIVTEYGAYQREIYTYRGLDAVEHFVDKIHHLYDNVLYNLLHDVAKMQISPIQQAEFDVTNICYLCNEIITVEDSTRGAKHRDHCHYTGAYLGAAHLVCNQARQVDKHLPIIFHNLTKYDGNILLETLCKKEKNLWRVNVIPKTLESYSSISTAKFRFIDSCQHLSHPLDVLVNNLTANGTSQTHIKLLKKYVDSKHGGSPRKLSLLSRKGVYPYTYMDSMDRFTETELPERRFFYNDLSGEAISNEDWNHVNAIWTEFNLQNLGELHDLYVESDVLLLGDVFEKYRTLTYKTYGLDPIHFYSLPGLSFEACLKATGVKLELIKDPEIHMMIERGIRGGVSTITHRHAQANHEGLSSFNKETERSHLLLVDANNLYGWAMSEKQPIRGFRFMKDIKHITSEWIRSYDDSSDVGYFLEVDIEIPDHLHDSTSEYPLCPEKIEVNETMISGISKSMRAARGDSSNFSSEKLAPNLYPKKNYVVHVRNLKFYLEKGAVLTKVHRVLCFEQEAWILKYIKMNTDLRRMALDEFERSFYKMLNNAFFGKTMENVRKHIKVVLISNALAHQWQTSKPGFVRFVIISNNLVAVELVKPNVVLNKPIYVGFTILELSKLHMFQFHYDTIKVNYPGSMSTLCFTDTDSFLYSFKVNDIYKDIADKGLQDKFDFSNYPVDHPLYSSDNAAVVGKFKDETKSIPISEFVGLRSKMYSILMTCKGVQKQKLAAAGVKKAVANKQLRHDLYRSALYNHGFLRPYFKHTDSEDVTSDCNHCFNAPVMLEQMKEVCDGGEDGSHRGCFRKHPDALIAQSTIQAKKYKLMTLKQTRVGLSNYDDKRWVLDDHSTRALGHRKNR